MAIQFNASGEYVDRDCSASPIVAAGVHEASPYTICAWVRRDGGAGTAMGLFGCHNAVDAYGASLVVRHQDTNALVAYMDANFAEDPSHTFVTDAWVYVALRWRPNLTISWADVDDVALTSNPTPRAGYNANAANFISCGRFPGLGNYFIGSIAHMRAWSADLSDAEILTERSSATAVKTSGLYLAWEFVADANDSSGNGRNGTVNGTVSYVTGPTLGGVASAVPAIAANYYRMLAG